jgi:hypothetical protein
LTGPVTNGIMVASGDDITLTTNLDKMALKITKATGLISGTFTNGTKTIKVNGVLLPNQTNAQGYFLIPGQTTSGRFLLGPSAGE